VSVAAATNLPLERGVNFPVSIGGRPDDFEGAVEWRAVTPGYFGTLGIEIVAGRAFSRTDERGGPPVVIVNEAFVRRYFPEGNPLGERIDIGRYRGAYIDPSLEGPGAEIVGVVRDIKEISLRTAARRTIYVPSAQAPTRIATVLGTMPVFLARSPGGGARVQNELREALRTVDPELPTPDVTPLRRVFAESLARERFSASLLGAFALLALTLTAFGIYGVLSYTVRQRRREIGIRMALGAGGGAVSRMVAVQGLAPVAVGLAVGTAGALALSRVVAGFLWGVSPTDPTNLAVVAGILLAVAAAASWLPTREAVRTDPVRSLSPE
jgi:predicted permease